MVVCVCAKAVRHTSSVGKTRVRAQVNVARAIGTCDSLVDASLQFNSFSDPGATELAAALAGHEALTALNLSYNRVHATGAEELCRMVAAAPRLALLEANGNPMGEAAKALGSAGTSRGVAVHVEECASDGLRGAPVPPLHKGTKGHSK